MESSFQDLSGQTLFKAPGSINGEAALRPPAPFTSRCQAAP